MHNAREKTKTRRKFVSRVPDQWRRHFIQQQKMKRNMINSRDKHRVCIFVLISFVCWQEASVSNGIFYRETFLILIFLMRDREIEKRTKPNVFSFRKSIFNSINSAPHATKMYFIIYREIKRNGNEYIICLQVVNSFRVNHSHHKLGANPSNLTPSNRKRIYLRNRVHHELRHVPVEQIHWRIKCTRVKRLFIACKHKVWPEYELNFKWMRTSEIVSCRWRNHQFGKLVIGSWTYFD